MDTKVKASIVTYDDNYKIIEAACKEWTPLQIVDIIKDNVGKDTHLRIDFALGARVLRDPSEDDETIEDVRRDKYLETGRGIMESSKENNSEEDEV